MKRLNYAVKPDIISVKGFVIATEQVCHPFDTADQLKAQVLGILKSAKLPKLNITKKERQTLAELRKEKSIMILLADKGKVAVMTDTDDYKQKAITMLSDNKTYEKLNTNPARK